MKQSLDESYYWSYLFLLCTCENVSCDKSVNTVIMLRIFESQLSSGPKSLVYSAQTGPGAQFASISMRTGIRFPGIQLPDSRPHI